MKTFNKIISENLNHMNTIASEWGAVQVTNFTEVNSNIMPIFDFPSNYNNADSLFKSNSNDDLRCELCGHHIKTSYWLQNDSQKLLLMVGSECVTHFDAQSGSDIIKDNKATLASSIVSKLINTNTENIAFNKGFQLSYKSAHIYIGSSDAQRDIPKDTYLDIKESFITALKLIKPAYNTNLIRNRMNRTSKVSRTVKTSISTNTINKIIKNQDLFNKLFRFLNI